MVQWKLMCQWWKLKYFLAELEWILSQTGAFKSEIQEDPRPRVKDVLFSKLRNGNDDDDDDDGNDWWWPENEAVDNEDVFKLNFILL